MCHGQNIQSLCPSPPIAHGQPGGMDNQGGDGQQGEERTTRGGGRTPRREKHKGGQTRGDGHTRGKDGHKSCGGGQIEDDTLCSLQELEGGWA